MVWSAGLHALTAILRTCSLCVLRLQTSIIVVVIHVVLVVALLISVLFLFVLFLLVLVVCVSLLWLFCFFELYSAALTAQKRTFALIPLRALKR